MFDLDQRQRALLLAGLELLRQQLQPKGRARLSKAKIAELMTLLRNGQRPFDAVHQHPAKGRRNRSYKIAGECIAHGSICIACEVTYHLADGPLEWCRECDLLFAAADEVTRSTTPTGRHRRKKSSSRIPLMAYQRHHIL